MNRLLTMWLCVALAAPGCATAIAQQKRDAGLSTLDSRVDPKLMADYIRQFPIGSRVKITRWDGRSLRATLMKHDTNPIVVQRRTRISEAPVEILVADIAAVELDVPGGGNVGRNIAIGAAAAAGATLTVLLVLAAIFSD